MIPIRPETRQALDKIDSILLNLDASALREVWHVLTALRGPDDPAEAHLKDATTALIRAVALPKSNTRIGFFANITREDSEQLALIRSGRPQPSTHFLSHAGEAFYALRLHWSSRNDTLNPLQKGD